MPVLHLLIILILRERLFIVFGCVVGRVGADRGGKRVGEAGGELPSPRRKLRLSSPLQAGRVLHFELIESLWRSANVRG